jgi:hypothetical protein
LPIAATSPSPLEETKAKSNSRQTREQAATASIRNSTTTPILLPATAISKTRCASPAPLTIALSLQCGQTYYTKEAFSDQSQLLLSETLQYTFAHSSKDFKHKAHTDLIKWLEDLGICHATQGVIAFAVMSKFGVVALKDVSECRSSSKQLKTFHYV